MGTVGSGRIWERGFSLGAVLVLISMSMQGSGQDLSTPPAARPAGGPPNPALTVRPPSKPKSPLMAEGKIRLDVIVADGAGKPALGLEPWDFKILDNNQPRKVLSFRAYDGAVVMPDPPVEVILVIDTANLPFQQVAFVRDQVDQFLGQDGGHLKQPTTLALLTDKGIRIQSRPSLDGMALAGVVKGIKGSVRTINAAMGGQGLVERFKLSIQGITGIAENESRRPGRKLLIWVGPGWPLLARTDGPLMDREQKRWFDSIVELSTRLREARMSVYSVSPEAGSTSNTFTYQSFLKGVSSYPQADSGNLALKVLATQTGGLIFGPDNNLVSQLNRCFGDANAFYRITFDPLPAAHADEYHELKIVVDKPGEVVRTRTGYYNEPPTE